jgi:hypothetical protein
MYYGGYTRDGIESVEMTVDGVPVVLENLYGYDFIGNVEMNVGQTYDVDITYNGNVHHNFDLTAADSPVINWPATYESTEALPINWDLDYNAEYQFLDGWAYNDSDDEDDDNFKEFDSSDRDWTIPANWLNSGYDYYDLSLSELNYIYSGDFLALSSGTSAVFYGDWRDSENTSKEQTEKFIKIVKSKIN